MSERAEDRSRSPRRGEQVAPAAAAAAPPGGVDLDKEDDAGASPSSDAPAGPMAELSALAHALEAQRRASPPEAQATGRSYLSLLDVEKHFVVTARKSALQPAPRFYVNFQEGDGGLSLQAVVRFNDAADASKSRIRWGLKVGLDPSKTPFLLGGAPEATSEESWEMSVVLTQKQEAFVRAVDQLVMRRMETAGVAPGGFMSALKSDASGGTVLKVKAVLACPPSRDSRTDWKICHRDGAEAPRVVHTQRDWPTLKRELEQYNGFQGKSAKLWIYPSPWTHGRSRCGNSWKISAAIVSISDSGASTSAAVCLSSMPAAEEDF